MFPERPDKPNSEKCSFDPITQTLEEFKVLDNCSLMVDIRTEG